MQAAKHGDPKKLKGAAREIRKSMKKSDLEHFTGKKPKNLPHKVSEGRDDIDKLPVPPETKSYARMTSKDIMDQPGGTSEKWRKSLALRTALTNQKGVKGFPSQDKAEDTSGKKLKESLTADQIVSRMLDFSPGA